MREPRHRHLAFLISHLSVKPLVAQRLSPYLRRKLKAAVRILKPTTLAELSVVLVDDQTMSQLHQRYLNRRGPTDVLSFPLEFDRRGAVVSGEIVICVPQARHRAKIEGTSLQNELLLYAIHGLLHLCGYDDRTARGFQAMHQLEDQILTKLGIGPIFQNATRRRRA